MTAAMRVLPGPHKSSKTKGLKRQTDAKAPTDPKGKSGAVSTRSPHRAPWAEKRARILKITREQKLTRAQIVERFGISQGLAAEIVAEARKS